MSPGELYLDTLAGFEPEQILYISNNNTADEMQNALAQNLLISVENSEINITVENPNKQVNEELKTTKRDTHSHGYGLKSIMTIAEKYGGATRFTQSNNAFVSYVTIPNKG